MADEEDSDFFWMFEEVSDFDYTEESKEVQQRDWDGLPTDLLRLLLDRLFLGDIKRLQTVCRAWGSTPTPTVQSPVLMTIGSNENVRCKFFHPLYKDPYIMDIPELSGSIPRFSKDGWLLMSKGLYSVFFFNPFTKATVKLPDLPRDYELKGITFTSSPTSSDCRVMGIYGYLDKYFHVATIRRGEGSWQVQNFEGNLPIVISHCNPVFHDGKFYCLGQDGYLGVYDPEDGNFRVLHNPRQPFDLEKINYLEDCEGRLLSVRNFLVESEGELLSVYLSFMGQDIFVFKLDFAKMEWERVDCLSDQMVFVSHTTSLSVKKVVEGMENKIYLPRINSKCGVFYSLSSGLYQTFGNDFSRKDLYETGELLSCCWIEPKVVTYTNEELNWFSDS